MSCGFQGNSDIFGVGLRAAYYLQILAVWFSCFFHYREIKGLRAINNVFLLAVIVALFLFFLNPQQNHVIEAFLLIHIGTATGFAGITEWTRYSNHYRATSKERLVLRIFIMIAGGIFWTYFWWKGLDLLIPTPCGTYIFCFAKINIFGWFRTLMKAFSICGLIAPITISLINDGGALFCNIFMKDAKVAFVAAIRAHTSSGLSKVVSSQPFKELNKSALPPSSWNSDADNIEIIVNPNSQAVSKTRLKSSFSTQDNANRSILDAILYAQKYLDSLYSIYKTEEDTDDRTTHSFRQQMLNFMMPWKRRKPHTDETSMRACFKRWMLSFITNNPSAAFKIVLFLHETATRKEGPWPIFRLVNRMYNLSLSKPPPDWRYLKIASDIHLSQIPCITSHRNWANRAISRFLSLIWLIILVELTIIWNQVGGLQSFSNLGQLIPFIIALGGLVKVLWGKAQSLREGRKAKPEGEEMGEYEMAIASYLESKQKAYPVLRLGRVATV